MTDVFSRQSVEIPHTTGLADPVENENFSQSTTSVREKDEVFWTELEIRRLGNLVAECIHARRYVGDDELADTERRKMRMYIEAMKRKSMRVLHRAELYSKRSHAAWPGIDSTISDPVSLAEEYVRVVENYEAVLCEEESSDRERRAAAGNIGERENIAQTVATEEDEWEAADSAAYKEALERERKNAKPSEQDRSELLGDIEGVRRRKRNPSSASMEPSTYSNEEEEFMARHQPIQDELTSNLVNLVGHLKESIVSNSDSITKDKKILDEAEEAIERNVGGVERQRTDLKKHTQSRSVSWWLMVIAALVIIQVFVLVLVLRKFPI